VAGMWRQHEVWDGRYTFSDLMDAHEILIVREENKRRAEEYAEQQRRLDNP